MEKDQNQTSEKNSPRESEKEEFIENNSEKKSEDNEDIESKEKNQNFKLTLKLNLRMQN